MKIIVFITILSTTVFAQTKKHTLYQQIIAQMGYYKVNMQCNKVDCKVLSFYQGNLMGETSMKLDIVKGIKSNFLSNFLKIEKSDKKCPGQEITIKYYKNYSQDEMSRCFIKNEYYSLEFQRSFTKVYKSVPPRKN